MLTLVLGKLFILNEAIIDGYASLCKVVVNIQPVYPHRRKKLLKLSKFGSLSRKLKSNFILKMDL